MNFRFNNLLTLSLGLTTWLGVAISLAVMLPATTLAQTSASDQNLDTLVEQILDRTAELTQAFDGPQRRESVEGYLDATNNESCRVAGWAIDKTRANFFAGRGIDPSIDVEIYVDNPKGLGTYVMRCDANQPRPDVNEAFGVEGNFGFDCALPEYFKTMGSRALYVYTSGGVADGLRSESKQLANSPGRIDCTPPESSQATQTSDTSEVSDTAIDTTDTTADDNNGTQRTSFAELLDFGFDFESILDELRARIREESSGTPTQTSEETDLGPFISSTRESFADLTPGSFSAGDVVVSTANLRVRVDPGTQYPIVSTVQIGQKGTIIGGPEPIGDDLWWQVRYTNGVTGWSVGDWLQQVERVSNSMPPQAPTPSTQSNPSPRYGFNEADRVSVTTPLRVRTSPSLTSDSLGVVTLGNQGIIRRGPQQADGYTWWYVEWANEVNGWSASNWLRRVSFAETAMQAPSQPNTDFPFYSVQVTPQEGVVPFQVRVLSAHNDDVYPDAMVIMGDGSEAIPLRGCARFVNDDCTNEGVTSYTYEQSAPGQFPVTVVSGNEEQVVATVSARSDDPGATSCTQEALLCPDGTTPDRDPFTCEWAPCSADQITY